MLRSSRIATSFNHKDDSDDHHFLIFDIFHMTPMEIHGASGAGPCAHRDLQCRPRGGGHDATLLWGLRLGDPWIQRFFEISAGCPLVNWHRPWIHSLVLMETYGNSSSNPDDCQGLEGTLWLWLTVRHGIDGPNRNRWCCQKSAFIIFIWGISHGELWMS